MPRIRNLGLAAALTLGLAVAAPNPAHALEAEYAPIVVKPSKDTFLRFIVWNQIWARAIQNNPGTITSAGGAGEQDEWSTDVALRRVRLLTFGKIGDDVLLMLHLGINNQTYRNNVFGTGESGPAFFIHDAWTEFKIVKSDAFRLDFGGGLLYWNGISRMTNASTLNFLALDAPITNWPLINANDQFARQLGLYVKGNVTKWFDYRIALVRPFSDFNQGTPADPVNMVPGSPGQNEWGLSTYFKLQIFDKESNTLPYAVGTYLGKKKVLNLGYGFHWHPGGSRDDMGNDADIFLQGIDVFADLPIGDKASGGALTAYAVLYLFDFGRDSLVRNIGIANIGEGVNPMATNGITNGRGNAYASVADGTSFYTQIGYLLPGKPLGLQIQPYVTAQLNAWDAFNDVAPVIEAGSNFYLYGHHSKFTINYRARPLMAGATFDGFASEFILQTMIFL